jgi:tetratricopeptide (TPR) repeat protein/S1-C subfamily serine protease
MYRSSLFLTATLVGTTVALVQPVAAKSATEIKSIAKAVTVEIKLQQHGSVGSGVIIDRKGDLYTLVTNGHVVCGENTKKHKLCAGIPTSETYNLNLADGKQYVVKASNVKLIGGNLDLAIIQFRSSRNYAMAKVAAPGRLKADDVVYTAGFPFEQPGFEFGEGKAIAVVNKRLQGDRGGYTIIYNAPTLRGMSGGGVFDSSSQLVAIHGQGDRFTKNTEIDDKSRVDSKIGLNRGIPIRWLVQILEEAGINLGTNSSSIRAAHATGPTTADEYFIAGFNKLVEPGDNVVAGKQKAIQEFSRAIRLNPRYQYAYFMRAIVYEQVREFRKSLADYDQSIRIDPKISRTYYNRALLKQIKLNDTKGALADYNQSIRIDPKYFEAYSNRGLLKYEKLNDTKGALADYDQSIRIDPKYSIAYYNRALLKYEKLNDTKGALADYDQAIRIDPKDSKAYSNRGLLKYEKLNDTKGALADYDQAISINPKYYEAYNNRANLRAKKLNDVKGALADYDQAIRIDPKLSQAYSNRAILKEDKLNDVKGALADYDQAIRIDPKFSIAYSNRGLLKYEKLNDRPGAIQDFRQAARLFREQGNTQYLQKVLKALQKLGATE